MEGEKEENGGKETEIGEKRKIGDGNRRDGKGGTAESRRRESGLFITCAPAAYNRGNRICKTKRVWAGRMRLYGEILKKIGGEDLFGGARYTVLPGRGGYFQGVRTVGEFSPSRVILGFRRAVLEIEGSGFVIEKYCDGDLELSGNIISVRLSDGTK